MDISKEYSKKLSELKPYLGFGFHSKISKSLKDIAKWKVRDAFNGKVADVKILRKVYSKAKAIADENKKELRRLKSQKPGIRIKTQKGV